MSLPELAQWYTASDGSSFMLGSEIVRGESRFYQLWVRVPGENRAEPQDWLPDGSYNKQTAMRRLRRAYVDYEAALQEDA